VPLEPFPSIPDPATLYPGGGLIQSMKRFPTRIQFLRWWREESRVRPDGCDHRLLHGHGLPVSWEWAPRNRVSPLARYLRTEGGLPRASVGLRTWGTGRLDDERPLPSWAVKSEREFDSKLCA
jgi:hypothetical protein